MKVIIFFVALFQVTFASDWYSRWMNAGDSWYHRWNNLADQSGAMSAEEKIDLFGRALRVGTKPRMNDEEKKVYDRIQKILLNTLGHAEYYENRIKLAQEHFEAQKYPAETPAEITNRAHAATNLSELILQAFPILGQLPSVETVHVLGEMLTNCNGLDENGEISPGFVKGTGPICTRAANALMALPLKNKPVKFRENQSVLRFEDIRPWQLWYAQVKAGTRTFSFEGDPNEYDLNGPVKESRDPDSVRAVKRPGVESEKETPKAEASEGSAVPWWVAALVAVAGGAGYFWVKRKANV